jgi:glyoxylase-like metal-dependent hydrolase (beta-lactamase superfamily II)
MADLYVRQLRLGPMENFVYLVGAQGAPEVAVVDPAWDVDEIDRAAAEDGKTLSCAIATHGHPDHVNGLPELLRRHDLPVYFQRDELAHSPALRELGTAVRALAPDEVMRVGPLEIHALHTPGHTPGSQCLLCGDALVTGDTIFVNACGRCDLKGGDPEAMFRTIQRLKQLPDSTRLFPGHDYGDVPVSTIGREKQRNPYFQMPDLDAFLVYRMS